MARNSDGRVARSVVTLWVLAAAVLVAVVIVPGSPLRLVRLATSPPGSGPATLDPKFFANGACVAYPPTHGETHRTVFLDAGHGGLDPGAVGETEARATVTEAEVNLAVELDAMRVLRAQGYRVVVSRTEQTTVVRLGPGDTDGDQLSVQGSHDDVAARDVCANLGHADLLVGIYMDAGASPTNAGCVTGWDAVRSFAPANLRFARLLQRDVLAAMNARGWAIPDEGVVEDSALGSALTSEAEAYGHLLLLGPARAGYFSTPSEMPGALIEPLFLTDPFEATVAADPADQRVIADGLAFAVDQYFATEPAKKAAH